MCCNGRTGLKGSYLCIMSNIGVSEKKRRKEEEKHVHMFHLSLLFLGPGIFTAYKWSMDV